MKEGHVAPTPAGNLEWPGPDGGANYGPSAYDPETADIYVAGINGPETLYASPQPQEACCSLALQTASSKVSRPVPAMCCGAGIQATTLRERSHASIPRG
ncbi:MAG: hypothetical protein ACYCYO_07465 [Bacilli bacterium]